MIGSICGFYPCIKSHRVIGKPISIENLILIGNLCGSKACIQSRRVVLHVILKNGREIVLLESDRQTGQKQVLAVAGVVQMKPYWVEMRATDRVVAIHMNIAQLHVVPAAVRIDPSHVQEV